MVDMPGNSPEIKPKPGMWFEKMPPPPGHEMRRARPDVLASFTGGFSGISKKEFLKLAGLGFFGLFVACSPVPATVEVEPTQRLATEQAPTEQAPTEALGPLGELSIDLPDDPIVIATPTASIGSEPTAIVEKITGIGRRDLTIEEVAVKNEGGEIPEYAQPYWNFLQRINDADGSDEYGGQRWQEIYGDLGIDASVVGKINWHFTEDEIGRYAFYGTTNDDRLVVSAYQYGPGGYEYTDYPMIFVGSVTDGKFNGYLEGQLVVVDDSEGAIVRVVKGVPSALGGRVTLDDGREVYSQVLNYNWVIPKEGSNAEWVELASVMELMVFVEEVPDLPGEFLDNLYSAGYVIEDDKVIVNGETWYELEDGQWVEKLWIYEALTSEEIEALELEGSYWGVVGERSFWFSDDHRVVEIRGKVVREYRKTIDGKTFVMADMVTKIEDTKRVFPLLLGTGTADDIVCSFQNSSSESLCSAQMIIDNVELGDVIIAEVYSSLAEVVFSWFRDNPDALFEKGSTYISKYLVDHYEAYKSLMEKISSGDVASITSEEAELFFGVFKVGIE